MCNNNWTLIPARIRVQLNSRVAKYVQIIKSVSDRVAFLVGTYLN